MTPAAAQPALALTPLREDLRLLPGAPSSSGAPHWLIYDPVQHRYFQIDARTRDLLALWPQSQTVTALQDAAGQKFEGGIGLDEIEKLVAFAEQIL